MAEKILKSLTIFEDEEISIICRAIYNHSGKSTKHSSFEEVLIDADVLQHRLYNPLSEVNEHEKDRLEKLKTEFCLM